MMRNNNKEMKKERVCMRLVDSSLLLSPYVYVFCLVSVCLETTLLTSSGLRIPHFPSQV